MLRRFMTVTAPICASQLPSIVMLSPSQRVTILRREASIDGSSAGEHAERDDEHGAVTYADVGMPKHREELREHRADRLPTSAATPSPTTPPSAVISNDSVEHEPSDVRFVKPSVFSTRDLVGALAHGLRHRVGRDEQHREEHRARDRRDDRRRCRRSDSRSPE